MTSQTPKKHVYVKAIFLKVGEIDTVKETYKADVFIQARWRDKTLDDCDNLTNIDLNQHWNPKLYVHNLLDHRKRKTWKELNFNNIGEAYIVENRRIKGTFSEKFELKEFPFDHQYLNVIMTSELQEGKLDILEDPQDLSAIDISCFVDEQEWSLFDYVETTPFASTKAFSPTKNIKFPSVEIGCCAARRAGYFIMNIVIIMSLIGSASFVTFAVDRSLPQNRLQLSITLMLTAVAFKLVTNANLPKISYYTHLDRYILFSMAFNWLITIWHAVITRFSYDNELQARMDNWAFLGFGIFYGLFIIIYTSVVFLRYVFKQQELLKKISLYEEKARTRLGKSWKSNRKDHVSYNIRGSQRRKSRVRPKSDHESVYPMSEEM